MEKQRKKRFCEKLRERKGFTLIEMVIVIAIIAILIALIAPRLTSFLGSARSTALQANAKTVYTSTQAYLTELYSLEGKTPVADQKVTLSETQLSFNSAFLSTSQPTLQPGGYFDAKELSGYNYEITFDANGVKSVVCISTSDPNKKATYPKQAPTT